MKRSPIKRSSKPIRKKSARPIPVLKTKLWDTIKVLCKQRDGNACWSCDQKNLVGSNWHPGHFVAAGSSSALRFHPLNIHSQCMNCNINLGGNGAHYARRIMHAYGMEFFFALESFPPTKSWKAWELETLIEKARLGLDEYTTYYLDTYGPKPHWWPDGVRSVPQAPTFA